MPDAPLALVADADPAVGDFVAVVLARAGFRVTRLPRPAAVEASGPDGAALVVVGGARLGVTAAGAAAALRSRGNGTPVLILANGHDPATAALAAADAGVRVLHKPFRPAELTAAALALLSARRPGAVTPA